MISKKELLQLIEDCEKGYKFASETYWVIKKRIQSLPDDTPDRLPLQWPIPDGMEVVTRDGRKAVKVSEPDCNGDVVYMDEEGRWKCWSNSKMFLRPIDRKVWVVEWNNGAFCVCDKKPDPNPIATIYEATLKQINQQS